MKQNWTLALFDLFADFFPLLLQTLNIEGQLLFSGTFSCGANNHSGILRKDIFQNLFETRTL